MKKIIMDCEITECYAIEPNSGEYMKALFVHDLNDEYHDGDAVVFGWDMPDNENDFENMIEESYAWERNYETLETVRFDVQP